MKQPRSRKQPATLLRWIFRRGEQRLTCQLERDDTAYALAVVPHWDLTLAALETYDAGISAFRRHAALASALRRGGWTVASYAGRADRGF